MTREIALHCMKSYSELHSDLCELCPIYGQTGSDHCFEDALQYVIGMLEQEPTTKNDLEVQKAIEIIKADSLASYSVNEILSARDLAVEALKQMKTTKNDLGVDCISRAEAIKCLECDFDITGKENMKTVVNYINSAHDKIVNLPRVKQEPIKPTVESRPVIHANWLSGDCKGAHCSNCEEYTPFVYGAYNFCPNCGADMRGKEE